MWTKLNPMFKGGLSLSKVWNLVNRFNEYVYIIGGTIYQG